MCVTCGCGAKADTTILNLQPDAKAAIDTAHGHGHEHVHADSTRHSHPHDHDHDHDHQHGGAPTHVDHDHGHFHADGTWHTHVHDNSDAHGPAGGALVDLETRLLAKNDAMAAQNRAWFAGREILTLNLVSSPGSGKTTLLERTIGVLKDALDLFVIEGDQATANDGERIRAAGAPVVQVNTGSGCHLEADMVARGVQGLKPGFGAVVLIENVGNLVCPALFDLGEHAKVAILSVTEGDDKPIKYPHMFRVASLVIINKTDLLPHVDFSVDRASQYAREVNPDVEVITLSARTGVGMKAWYDWLADRVEKARSQPMGNAE